MHEILIGNCRDRLRELEANSVQCVVTSPPYWGLRRYEGEQEAVWGGDVDCEHEWVSRRISTVCATYSSGVGSKPKAPRQAPQREQNASSRHRAAFSRSAFSSPGSMKASRLCLPVDCST